MWASTKVISYDVGISRCTLGTCWNSNSKKKYGAFPVDSGMKKIRTDPYITPQTPNQSGAKKLQLLRLYVGMARKCLSWCPVGDIFWFICCLPCIFCEPLDFLNWLFKIMLNSSNAFEKSFEQLGNTFGSSQEATHDTNHIVAWQWFNQRTFVVSKERKVQPCSGTPLFGVDMMVIYFNNVLSFLGIKLSLILEFNKVLLCVLLF